MGDVDNINHSCRLSLQAILKKHTGVLSTNEYKSFNLGNGIEEYILPSLNLSPKVHKLKERACIDNEKLLTGRPIITDACFAIYLILVRLVRKSSYFAFYFKLYGKVEW